MKSKIGLLLIGLIMICGVTMAGTSVAVVNNTSVYRALPDGATTTIKAAPPDKTAIQLCMEKAQADAAASGLETFKATCTDVFGITVTSNCDGVKKPVWPIEKDADGFVLKPGFKEDGLKPGTDGEVQFQVEDFVSAPPPKCWIKGWRIAQDADFTEEYVETPNSIEPMVQSAEFLAYHASPEACTKRHDVCDIYEKGNPEENCGAPPAKCVNAENFYQ